MSWLSPSDHRRVCEDGHVSYQSVAKYVREAPMRAITRAKVEAASVRLGIELPASLWRGMQRNRTSPVPNEAAAASPARLPRVVSRVPLARARKLEPVVHPPMAVLLARRPPLPFSPTPEASA